MFRIGARDRMGRSVPLSEIISELFKKLDAGKEYTIEDFKAQWPDVAGQLSQATTPVKIEDGMLHITANHPVIRQELVMLKSAIMARWNEKYSIKIRDIRVV